ncbi:MAG: Fe-S cluster assembly protein SufD [Planctomycetota bacterium]|nr:Fe-S cluster assembly protein SufD [Planctomycetota bacterium]
MTTVTEDQIAFDDAGFQSFLDARNEPDWLTELRRSAWQQFSQMEWPTKRDEEWMRTDIRLFKLNRFAMPAAPLGPQPASVLDQGVDLAGRVVALDAVPQSSELDPEVAAQGVLFGGLAEMLQEHGEKLKPFFHRAFDPGTDRFSALHAAFWSTGCVLYVPRGVVVEKPLHAFSGMSEGGVDLAHTLVIVEDGAEATLLAESASDTETSTGFHCGAIELIVGDQANLRYVNLQDWGQGVWHFAHQKAMVGRDSNLQWTAGALGSRLSKVNQHVDLNGVGANCQVNGVMFTEKKQHLSYHTLQQHKAPHCTSDFLYKAALQDTSRTVWRGMIKVDEGAQKTDGFQRNDNLLLSHQARADSIPGLEIEADDVRCTHGSTSGRVDEELIFYARSRGFTRKEAVQMIVTGFFQQVFDRVTIESVREALGLAISRRVRDYE